MDRRDKSAVILLVVAVVAILGSLYFLLYQNSRFEKQAVLQKKTVVLFSKPANAAQKVANFVFANGKIQPFNADEPDEGASYSYKFYIANEIHEVIVDVYKNGLKDLKINYYLTNVPLEDLKTPADLAALELMYGRSEIYIENHITDDEMDMSVDLCQAFMKKIDGCYSGFTRAERDSETSGVKEYIYRDGKELKNKKWVKAPKKTVEAIEKIYASRLFVLYIESLKEKN